MKYLLSFLLACCALPALALSPISGGIHSDTTLSLANSPYVVTGDLVIFDAAKLTIEPGVEILVDKDKKIEIRGKISAIGTAAQPIYVHGNTQLHGKNYWEGFVFVITNPPANPGTTADLDYFIVSDAKYAFNMNSVIYGLYRFRNSLFSYNGTACWNVDRGDVLIDGCTFTNNGTGLHIVGKDGQVRNCTFDANLNGVSNVIWLTACRFTNNTNIAIRSCGSVSNCDVYNNNIGVESMFNNGSHTFINNKVKNNTIGVRMQSFFNGDVNFTGNEICSNTFTNIDLVTKNNADLSNNCWCLPDSLSIRQKLRDGYVDVNQGIISFVPFNTGCTNLAMTGTEMLHTAVPSVTISPNPVSGNQGIRVAWQGIADKSVRILFRNVVGQVMPHEELASGTNYVTLHTSAAPGVYYISVVDVATGNAITKKVILQ